MGRRRRAKRQSRILTSLEHLRAVRPRHGPTLGKELEGMLDGAPDGLAQHVARAATLSAPEAKRMLELAAQRHDGLHEEQVAQARALIEKLAVAP